MNADGSNRTRLTNDTFIDGVPAWSPDGTKIVFMSGSANLFNPNSFEIFVMNADGSNRVQLTTNTIIDGQPSYSPDGTKILFASGDFMNPDGIEIFVMNANGSNRTQITTNTVTDGFPAWSSDGSRIVFASGSIANETTVELFVMNADSSNRTRLTTNTGLDWFPDWKPASTPTTIQFSAANLNPSEAVGSQPVMITRSGGLSGTSNVDYATSDTAGVSPCSTLGVAASSRCDYLTTLGTLHFATGETTKTISIPIIDDVYADAGETFTIGLSNATGATVGAPATATLTIADNETVNGTNPIDTAGFFVRQHYVDFLNREPDPMGLSFWTNEITGCTPTPQCIEIKRINVSGAFFLSIEFQETGYLVYRFYKSGFGNLSGAPVPVRLNEFLKDTQQIGKGVQVGIGNWEAQLEANKQAYALAFVQRADFQAAFPDSMTPTQFVNQLDTNAGFVLSPTEKNDLVLMLLGGRPGDVTKRASVLRSVAEDADLKNAEFNKAFVLMQYFGYLRRNPNDAPDTNFSGWQFWFDKLNQFNGNFVNAEMVKAFLVSDEYRHRFGP